MILVVSLLTSYNSILAKNLPLGSRNNKTLFSIKLYNLLKIKSWNCRPRIHLSPKKCYLWEKDQAHLWVFKRQKVQNKLKSVKDKLCFNSTKKTKRKTRIIRRKYQQVEPLWISQRYLEMDPANASRYVGAKTLIDTLFICKPKK